jgi:acyl-CoA synthetase (AMP-forming)/AMP-acid ligase II
MAPCKQADWVCDDLHRRYRAARSSGDPPTDQTVEMDVRGLMAQAAKLHAQRIAVIDGARQLTFAEAWTRGIRLANALLALGLVPGDRIGVLEDNSIEAQDFFAGATIAGLVRVPLYARNSAEAHIHMLDHTGCRAVMVAEHYAHEINAIRADLPDVEHVIVRDSGYEQWLAGHDDVDPNVPIDPDDWYIIRHTGGTTGKSKGVAYTHRSWLATGRDWFYNFPPMIAGERCLHVGPISHGSGYLYTPTWLSGGVNVLLDHFDPADTIEVMERERVGYMFAVPAMLNALARHETARSRDWSALKVIQIGGAPIADETALLARDVFGMVLYQGFGQTEAVPVCMMGPQEWFSDVKGSEPLRSTGRALPEFWGDSEATAERITPDGFVLTGDIGRLDVNGYLYVLDRKDDMIISGGFNIWPAELENVIADHPGVVEVAVFSVPDDRWGETPMAVCSVADGIAVDDARIIDEIRALCVDHLGSYKKPTHVELRAEPLPKSPVGKIQRKVLREPHWAGHDRRVAGN